MTLLVRCVPKNTPMLRTKMTIETASHNFAATISHFPCEVGFWRLHFAPAFCCTPRLFAERGEIGCPSRDYEEARPSLFGATGRDGVEIQMCIEYYVDP